MCGMHMGEVLCAVGNIIMPDSTGNYLSVKDAAGRIHPVTYITKARRVRDRRETGEGQKSAVEGLKGRDVALETVKRDQTGRARQRDRAKYWLASLCWWRSVVVVVVGGNDGSIGGGGTAAAGRTHLATYSCQ